MGCAAISISHIGSRVRLSRHRHETGYAALVLAGGYCEAGDAGRFRVGAGDVLFHDRFEAHQDSFGMARTALIDFSLAEMPRFVRGRIDDADAIVRLAEADKRAATRLLLASVVPDVERELDWPDVLAADILADQVDNFSAWADLRRLRPGSVSRGFRLAYGVTPQRFRLEARARRAARLLAEASHGLADIAASTGFADQQHMTRSIRSIVGETPRALRNAHAHCVQ